MSRIRTIKPEWLTDERLVLASPEARVLSVALLLLADDEGRGSANLAILGGHVFPLSPGSAESALAELRPWFARLYRVRGQVFFSVVNWKKHQRIDRPSPARTPKPSEGQWIDDASRVIHEDSATPREPVTNDPRILDEGSWGARASRASPPPPDPDPDPDPDPGQSEPAREQSPKPRDRFAESFTAAHPDDVWVFERWSEIFSKPGAKFDHRRGLFLLERRQAGMSRRDAEDALTGASFDDYVLGKKDGKRHDRLSFIFGDQERFEEFRDIGRRFRETGAKPTKPSHPHDAVRERAERIMQGNS